MERLARRERQLHRYKEVSHEEIHVVASARACVRHDGMGLPHWKLLLEHICECDLLVELELVPESLPRPESMPGSLSEPVSDSQSVPEPKPMSKPEPVSKPGPELVMVMALEQLQPHVLL